MAPSSSSAKRQRSSDDSGDEDDQGSYFAEGGIAQSTLSPDARKRPRLDRDQQNHAYLEDSTDEESVNRQFTQWGKKERRKQRTDNQAADNGIIESVTCTNFMCHAFLEVTLGPLINFIVGHNGSGKSAVLTAIMLCLGGKATSTNRAGNLKGFIKEGQEHCTLCVKIKNRGDTGFQQEVYGDSIIVERTFSKFGTPAFKLKSSSGRLISTRKGDLEEICDFFALQIDNPMSVLTQDMARQFLNSSSAAEKHKFFVKGTQLEQLNQDYTLLSQSIDEIEQTFTFKRQDIAVLEENLKKAQSLQDLSNKQAGMREKIRMLARQMAWVQVEEQEYLLASFDDKLIQASSAIEIEEGKVQETSEWFDQADQACENANEAVQGARTDLEPLSYEKGKAKEEYDTVKADAKDVQADQRKIKDSLRLAEARIDQTKKDIAEEYRRLEQANGGSNARRMAELEQHKTELAEAKARLEEHNSVFEKLEDARSRASRAVQDIEGPLRAKKSELEACENQLQSLIRDKGQQQRGYPPNMNQLVSAISKDNGFQQRPVGPVGDTIRLLEPAWSSILEKTLGVTLNSFIVTSKQDQIRLSGLMQRLKCSYPILIGNNNLFDYSKHEAGKEFLTSLRALEVINNETVLRQLIINQGIEQTILIENMEEAREVMDQNKLPNVRQCFSLNNKAKHGAGVRLTYGWEGTLSSNYVDPYVGPPRMKTDIEYQIKSRQDDLQRVKHDFEKIMQEQRRLQIVLKDSEQTIVRHHRETKDLKVAMQRADSVVEDFQEALDRDAVEEGRLDVFKASLEEAITDKDLNEKFYEEAIIARDKLMDAMKTHHVNLRIVDTRIAEMNVRVEKLGTKALKLSDQRQTALQKKNASIQLLDDTKEQRKALESERIAKAETVANYTEQASGVGTRIPIERGETAATIEKKLEKLMADNQRYEARIGGNQQKIEEDLAEATRLFNQAVNRFEEEEKLAQLLKITLINRLDRWRMFRKFISARARWQFSCLLSERGFRGRLVIDAKNRLLDLDVQPDETQANKGRKTQTLSGGEKSYSTICLLLSLWEAMGAPIRCLDEFDVFMDSVNRDVSMKMMIKAATRSVGRQFILITPQSMDSVVSENDVKIIKLGDPERGQTTLPFTAL